MSSPLAEVLNSEDSSTSLATEKGQNGSSNEVHNNTIDSKLVFLLQNFF
jgi:hypothetical protein